MTNAYYRVMRAGVAVSVELERLTPEERSEVLSEHEQLRALDIACGKLRECEEFLGELEAEGLIFRSPEAVEAA